MDAATNQLELLFQQMGMRTSVSLYILGIALVACRVLPLCIMSPFLGGDQIDPQVKIAVGVMLSIVIFPAIEARLVSAGA